MRTDSSSSIENSLMSDCESDKAGSSEEDAKGTGQYEDDDEERNGDKEEEKNSDDSFDGRRSRPRKEHRKRCRLIDYAAEESEDHCVTRDNDDDEEEDEHEDEEEDDVKRPGHKRPRTKFVARDDEVETVGKKEIIFITAREKRPDREDYELISENTGIKIAVPDDVDEEDSSDGHDFPTKPRRRVRRSTTITKTTERDFETCLGNVEAGPSSVETQNRRQGDACMDESENDSTDDFIVPDIPDDGRDTTRKKRVGGSSSGISVEKHRLAVSWMGCGYGKYADQKNPDKDVDPDGMDPYKDYEPEVWKENYKTMEDTRIRQIDEPERLQIDLRNRIPVTSVSDLKDEAEWMLSKLRCKASALIEDTGNEIKIFVHPITKEEMRITKTERAQIVQEQLVKKIVNVLCYIRGVENKDIQHGPITLKDVDADGPDDLPDSEDLKIATAKFDVPFIAKYRQEYWRDELDASDLWKIYDLDGKYSAFRERQGSLVDKFRKLGDDEGAEKAERAVDHEGISDVQAYFDIRHSQSEGDQTVAAEEEAAGGRPAPFLPPVQRTKYQTCELANLGEMVKSFTIRPEQLSANIRNSQLMYAPVTPQNDPTSAAIDRVPHAENFGFRDADAVLRGVKYMAAIQLATEPSIRGMMRYHLVRRSLVTVTMTRKGEKSLEMYHRPLIHINKKGHRQIDEETMLQLVKARDDGLVTVKIRMSDEDHQKLVQSFRELYVCPQDPGEGPHVAEWNRLRTEIVEEALQGQVYVFFEAEVLNVRTQFAKELVLVKCQEKLEGMLRVAPYSWLRDQGSKAERPNRIMAVTYGEPTECVVIDAMGEVVDYLSIKLQVSANVNQPMQAKDRSCMVDFVQRMQPDVLVLGAKELRCRTLKKQLDDLVNHCQTLGHLPRQIDRLYADQSVAVKYAQSDRAAQEFPEYPRARLVAVSLARRLLDPLQEMAGLCTGFTDDVLSLQLHPLQDMLDKGQRRKYLHRAFVNVVSEVGVDINLAVNKQLIHGHALQFVSGLGPRKATELMQVLKKEGCVQHRMQLLRDETVRKNVMRNVVWSNAVGFFRITTNSSGWNRKLDIGQELDGRGKVVVGGGGPMEGTRIHPESYKLAENIANDALEEVGGRGRLVDMSEVMKPENFKMLDMLDLEAYADSIRQAFVGIYQQIRKSSTHTT